MRNVAAKQRACALPRNAVVLLGLTAAWASAAGPVWRFVAVGDSRGDYTGVNQPIWTELVNRILAEDADVVIIPGDLVNGGDVPTTTTQLNYWRALTQPLYDAGIHVLAIRGNHEMGGGSTSWNTAFSGAYAMPGNGPVGEVNVTYSLTHNNAFFVGLDDNIVAHRINQGWLDAQFAANRRPHVFVFAHEPAFKAQHADCLDDAYTYRNTFWSSIAAEGGRTYFCGHDHFYNHARIQDADGDPNDDLHQLIVGTGGAPFHTTYAYDGVNTPYTPVLQYFAIQYGYVVIDVIGLDVTLTWMQRTAANTYTATEMWSYSAPAPAGDCSLDGYLDLDDVIAAEPCFLGPDVGPGCECIDLNGDYDTDLADIADFQLLASS
jgi:hypothetical protein